MSIQFSTIAKLRNLLDKKEISINEIYAETKNLFKLHNQKLNSFVEFFDDLNLNELNNSFFKNNLSGIPFLPKDNICQKGRLTTAASEILKGFISPYDATLIERLNKDGAFSVGRANCDQFAMGSSGETSFYGPALNPWDMSRVPGGSSSGSAVAVAAGIVPFALGTETGGSVRQPACLCGIVGLKPTYGIISRFGLIAYASSLDQAGIFTRTVYDNASVFSSMAGNDKRDATSSIDWDYKDYTSNLKNASLKGKKIAVIKNAIEAKGMNPEVVKKLNDVINLFIKEGATVDYIELKTMEYSAAVYFVVSRAEAASNLSRFDGVKYGFRAENFSDLKSMYSETRKEGFGDNTKRRILIGNYVLSSGFSDKYYLKAKEVQKIMELEFCSKLEKYDAIFSPVSPDVAFKLNDLDELSIDLQDYFTAAANLTGLPALAIPCGFVNELPVGFQIYGKKFDEEMLFEIGHAYQMLTDWHTKTPKDFIN